MIRTCRSLPLVLALCLGALAACHDSTQPTDPPNTSVEQGNYTAIVAGGYHTCALDRSGQAWCWGDIYSSGRRNRPELVTGVPPLVALAAGGDQTCGLTDAGAAYCWATDSAAVPAPAAPGMVFASLTLGVGFTCGLTPGGDAWCWGYNAYGQLGNGTSTSSATPVQVVGGHTFMSLAAALYHVCGVATSGTMYCWGSNWLGELGLGQSDLNHHETPAAVPGNQVFSGVAVGFASSCGLTPQGGILCWGGCLGEIGNGVDFASSTPVPVAGGRVFSELSGLGYHYCGISGTDALCWGSNEDGQLGDGLTDTTRLAPAAVHDGLAFSHVAVGQFHTCGLTTGGVAYCWGWNLQGQLGDGTQTERDVPTRVAGQTP